MTHGIVPLTRHLVSTHKVIKILITGNRVDACVTASFIPCSYILLGHAGGMSLALKPRIQCASVLLSVFSVIINLVIACCVVNVI